MTSKIEEMLRAALEDSIKSFEADILELAESIHDDNIPEIIERFVAACEQAIKVAKGTA